MNNLKTILKQEGKEKTKLYKSLTAVVIASPDYTKLPEEISKLSTSQLRSLKSMKFQNSKVAVIVARSAVKKAPSARSAERY